MDVVAHCGPIHITLIHGTFSKNAAWTRDGSPLRAHLLTSLGNGVRFHEFRWSGLPSHIARHIAANQLQNFLRNLFQREQEGKHFLIAHSHGGMVALYALRDRSVAEGIDGLVTLSTPFLVPRRRDLSVLGQLAVGISLLTAFAVLAQLAQYHLRPWLSAPGGVYQHPWYIVVPATVANIAAPLAVLMGLLALLGIAFPKMNDWFFSTLSIPKLESARILIVRGPSDEASALLTAFHLLQMVVSALWQRRGGLSQ